MNSEMNGNLVAMFHITETRKINQGQSMPLSETEKMVSKGRRGSVYVVS